jgi:hypothetical protein
VGLDLGMTHGWITTELARGRSVADSMNKLIGRCEAAYPHSDWVRLRALPYADLSALIEWIVQPFRDEPPARPLRGLWFGLFNPRYDERETVADIYLCGSERFDPDPDSNEMGNTSGVVAHRPVR